MGLALLFLITTQQFQLPPGLLSALCYVESTHNPEAIHLDDGGTNSVGLCQIKLATAKWMGFKGTEEQLMDPHVNAYYAGKYLAYQLKRYGHVEKAIIAYNRGNAKGLLRTEYSAKVFKEWNSKRRTYENNK